MNLLTRLLWRGFTNSAAEKTFLALSKTAISGSISSMSDVLATAYTLPPTNIEDALNLQQQEIDLQLISFSVNLVSTEKKLTKEVDLFINNCFRFWVGLHAKILKEEKTKLNCQFFERLVTQIHKVLLLIDLDKQFLLDYLQFYHAGHMLKKGHIIHNYASHCKFIFSALPTYDYTPRETTDIVLFCTHNSITLHYRVDFNLFLNKLIAKLPSNWFLNSTTSPILGSLRKIGRVPSNLFPKLIEAIESPFTPIKLLKEFLVCALEYELITPQRFCSNDYKAIFQRAGKSKYFFQETFQHFYRSGLWVPSYWTEFFRLLSRKAFSINIYDEQVLRLLLKLQSQLISPEILKQAKIVIDGKEANEKDLKLAYNQQHQQKIKKKMSCQMALTGGLKMLNKAEVMNEQLVGIFFVDILINRKYVIQLNSSLHYKEIDGKSLPNLKTLFKRRILYKLGYHYIEIVLGLKFQSGLSVVEEVFALMEKWENLKTPQFHIVQAS